MKMNRMEFLFFSFGLVDDGELATSYWWKIALLFVSRIVLMPTNAFLFQMLHSFFVLHFQVVSPH